MRFPALVPGAAVPNAPSPQPWLFTSIRPPHFDQTGGKGGVEVGITISAKTTKPIAVIVSVVLASGRPAPTSRAAARAARNNRRTLPSGDAAALRITRAGIELHRNNPLVHPLARPAARSSSARITPRVDSPVANSPFPRHHVCFRAPTHPAHPSRSFNTHRPALSWRPTSTPPRKTLRGFLG